MLENTEPDYITINSAVVDGKFNVVIMHWDRVQDGYVVMKCSEMLVRQAAIALAASWAAAMGRIEIR